MMRITLIAALAMVLAACATSPTGRGQLMLVSPSQISEMGIATFNDMREQGKFANAPKERAYATCVANALINVLPPPWSSENWQVAIIDDSTPNAFALPGGRIGVNRGMFKVARTQDQLAAVLGHELAHVVAHHPAERVSDNLATQLGASALNAYGVAKGMNPETMQTLLGIGSQTLVLLPFSRTQESEADVLGQRYMAQAGFDPQAAVTLWQNMDQANKGARAPTFLSTHPAPGNRIATLSAKAPALESTARAARANGHTPACKL